MNVHRVSTANYRITLQESQWEPSGNPSEKTSRNACWNVQGYTESTLGMTRHIRGQSSETHGVTHGVELNVMDGGSHAKVTGKSKGNTQGTNCATIRRRQLGTLLRCA